MKQEAHIAGWGISVPYVLSTERFIEKDREIRLMYGQDETTIELVHNFVLGTGIHTRHVFHPCWLPENTTPDNFPEAKKLALTEDIFTEEKFNPPFWKRMSVFQDSALKLAVDAAKKAVTHWGGDPGKISHVLATCSSGWCEPGVAHAVIKELMLSEDCQKADLYFNGCFCGATCLRLARDIIRAGDATGVLVVAVEAASAHYDPTDTELSTLVTQSLFADGAGAMVIAPEGSWKYKQTGMSTVPDSAELLGLFPPVKPGQNIYKMNLDKNVGVRLSNYFKLGHGRELIEKMYDPNEELPALAIHPGGPRILDGIKDVFFDLGWDNNALQTSYDTLQGFGNLGSTALLFVLTQILNKTENSGVITMAFGPGVTVEWATLEKVS